jgi:hypothetical protein
MQDKLQLPFDSLIRRATFIIWLSAGIFLSSSLVYAHGDDNVTATSFIGPLVAFVVFAAVVGLGKALLRAIVKKA